MTGKHKKIRKQNELETLQCQKRDHAEKEKLIFSQLDERRILHEQIKAMKAKHSEQVAELNRDIGSYRDMAASESKNLKEKFQEVSHSQQQPKPRASKRRSGFERDL